MAVIQRSLTPERIRRSLAQQLPREISDPLQTAVDFRCSARVVTAIVPNAVWDEVFRQYAAEACEQLASRHKMRLRIVSRLDAVDDAAAAAATFDSLLEDPGNQFALTSCRRIVDAPGTEYNPLLLYGPHGSGKTHLLASVARAYRDTLGEEAAVRLDGPGFIARDARILATTDRSDLHERLENAALICFDDVDALSDRHMAQEELYLVINRCLEQGRQLMFTSLHPPQQLPGLEDRLTSRLAWGLTVAIDLPLPETRLALLRQRAGEVIAERPAEELDRLIDTFAPDMNQVVHLATRLRTGERLDHGVTHFDRILDRVARHFGVRPGEIAGKRRHRQVAIARQTALLLGRRLTDHSLVALGGMVGGRDHTTVLYNLERAERRLKEDPTYATAVNTLTQEVLHR